MLILGIDPGQVESGIIMIRTLKGQGWSSHQPLILTSIILKNELVEYWIQEHPTLDIVICERVRAMGMPLSDALVDTAEWTGRFKCQVNQLKINWSWLTRSEVKLHLCGSARAKDANVRQALLDRWGGKVKAIGTKKTPGPLYGVKSHCWSALAVAVTWAEQNKT